MIISYNVIFEIVFLLCSFANFVFSDFFNKDSIQKPNSLTFDIPRWTAIVNSKKEITHS